MEFFFQTISEVSAFLAAHTVLSYAIMFWWSFFETLIGIGFFLYGELIFLPAAILAGAGVLNIWLVSFFLIAGGVCGDSVSYFIGRRVGKGIFKEENKFFSLTNYQKGEDFINKYGVKSVFFARLLGPMSWVTPFLSGIYHIKYLKFLAYNVAGVTVGIGEFLVIGYFFGSSYRQVLAFVQRDIAIILFVSLLVLVIIWDIKRSENGFVGHVRTHLKRKKKIMS